MISASPYLKIFLLEHYLNPSRYDYNIVFSRRLLGPIDIKKLELAFEKTVKESAILNSHLYINNENSIYWKENPTNSREKLSYFKNISKKQAFIKTPFDLFKGPLYRFALFQTDIQTHDLVIILHQTIIDAQSMDIFINRISSYYNDSPIKKLPSIEHQAKLISNSSKLLENNINFLYRRNKGKNFWKDRLKEFNFRNVLPYIKSKQISSSSKVCIRELK